MRSGEELVQAVLRVVERERGDLQARAPETWRADRNQQGRRGLPARGQIAKAFADQISAREGFDIHGRLNYTAESAARLSQLPGRPRARIDTFWDAWALGWPRISAYDPGWYEWSRDPGNPIATGPLAEGHQVGVPLIV